MLKVIAVIAVLINSSSYNQAAELNRRDMFCLATVVYHEAEGEEIMGKVAVAWNVKHRVLDNDFPDTICEVVYQNYPSQQYSYIQYAEPDYQSEAWKDSVEAAILSWIGFIDDPIQGMRFFYNPDLAEPWTTPTRQVKIGNHLYWDIDEIQVASVK